MGLIPAFGGFARTIKKDESSETMWGALLKQVHLGASLALRVIDVNLGGYRGPAPTYCWSSA